MGEVDEGFSRPILLFRLSALGDVTMLLPVLRQLGEDYPGLHITLVSQPFAEDLIAGMRHVRLLPARIRTEHQGLRGLWNLAREIKRQGPYLAIADAHDILRGWIILAFLRLMYGQKFPRFKRIDKGRAEKRRLTRTSSRDLHPLRHTVLRYADIFTRLGLPVNVPYELGGHKRVELPEPLQVELSLRPTRVGIAPFAKHKGKIYPLRQTKVLINILASNGVSVFLFGAGAREIDQLRTWKSQAPNVICVPDLKLSLQQEIELMARLRCMISMDSANMHLASWAGTRVVSIWGATHPYAGFLGWGQDELSVIQRNDLGCRPCSIYGNRPCQGMNYECLNINPLLIARAALE